MIKLLFIFLLISCNLFSQISITETPTGAYTYSTSRIGVTNSQTYTAGKLYIILYMAIDETTTPGDFGVTGTGTTWTEVANITGITTGTNLARLKVFRCVPTVTVTEGLTYTVGAFIEGAINCVLEVCGVLTNGTNGSAAIVQAVTGSADATADPSITMASLTGSNNTVFAFFGNDVNPFGATMESGWDELSQGGFNTPATGGVFIQRNTTTDNTPSVVASASNWVGVAIELAAFGNCNKKKLTLIN